MKYGTLAGRTLEAWVRVMWAAAYTAHHVVNGGNRERFAHLLLLAVRGITGLDPDDAAMVATAAFVLSSNRINGI